jgi:hypothetical protein
MRPEVFSELQKLRNQIAHGVQPAEPASLARRFAELGLSIPTADIPKLTQTILAVFRGSAGFLMIRRCCFRRFQNSWMAHPQESSVIRGQDLGNSRLLSVNLRMPRKFLLSRKTNLNSPSGELSFARQNGNSAPRWSFLNL